MIRHTLHHSLSLGMALAMLLGVLPVLASVEPPPQATIPKAPLTFEGTIAPSWAQSTAQNSTLSSNPSANLLSNPGAETGDLSGWNILLNGGEGWAVATEAPHEGSYSFITSFYPDTRYQEIDLLTAGFPAWYLDNSPLVTVGEWFRGFDCGGDCNPADYYYIKVELRDAAHAVIASWNVGTTNDPAIATTAWTEQTHAFSGYGTGLRYLYFEDGGEDAEGWRGHFGTQMDDAYATVETNLLSNPGAETGDLSGWNILLNGGEGWVVATEAPHEGSYSFITSHNWDTRYQEIDLLTAGFPAWYLDNSPLVTVGEWFRGFDCGGGCNPADYYYIKVELRDAAHVAIASWNVGTTNDPAIATTAWTEQTHAFSGYGASLRYLYFEDGGRDVEYWEGHYGTQMDSAYAAVEVRCHRVFLPVVMRGDQ